MVPLRKFRKVSTPQSRLNYPVSALVRYRVYFFRLTTSLVFVIWDRTYTTLVLLLVLFDYAHHDQVPLDQVTSKITLDIFDGVLEPIWEDVKHWLSEVDDYVKGDKDAFGKLYLETMHKRDHFDELYHEHGPVEFTAARMDYLLDRDAGYQKISERTGMPLEAIPAIVETHKGKSWKEKYG